MEESSLIIYNVFEEDEIELKRPKTEENQSFFCNESSTVLKIKCEPPPKIKFNFLVNTRFNIVVPFEITITKKKFFNIYYGYDSTAFCLIKSDKKLSTNKRYIIYGSLTRNKLFFLNSLSAEEINYKDFCEMLLQR